MTEKIRIAIVGAGSLRGKELNEVLPGSAFSAAEIVLIGDDSQAGQIEASGDEATFIQSINRNSFEHIDFAFFVGAQEVTKKHWHDVLRAGASIVDLSYVLEGQPGVLVRAPWLAGPTAAAPQGEDLNLSTLAVVPAHPVALALGLIMSHLEELGHVRAASATVLEAASEYGREAINELHQQTVSLLNFQSLPKEVYEEQVAFNVVPSFGDSKALGQSEARIRRHYALIRSGRIADVGIQLLHAPVFHGAGLSLAFEFDEAVSHEQVETALSSEHIEVVPADVDPPNNLSSAGQSEVMVCVRTEDGTDQPAKRFWIWASFDNLRIASLNAVACANELRRLRPKGKVQ